MSASSAILTHTEPTQKTIRVALVGNPNSGKSSLFNRLTGLSQKIGNYPGVTVDKKTGKCALGDQAAAEITDLPGTYSIFPRSADEQVVMETLLHRGEQHYPDVVVVVADMTNLERSLLLFTEIQDLLVPVILVLNMVDTARELGLEIDTDQLARQLGGVPIITTSARSGEGIDILKQAMVRPLRGVPSSFDVRTLAPECIDEVKRRLGCEHDYEAYLWLHYGENLSFVGEEERATLAALKRSFGFDAQSLQEAETKNRYQLIQHILTKATRPAPSEEKLSLTERIDRIVTHRVGGYLIFFGVLFLIFQAIFAWATVPMDFIDFLFSELSIWAKAALPAGVLTDLLAEGIIPGIGGVVIFVPQIALLFAMIALLEESGYMSRVVFLMDKLMRKAGLNGRSVVPLISGLACAIPAIMATRSIDHWKDRLITIFVTPLMSCSARLPVYTILIALVVPNTYLWGIISLQGLALMGMYLLGFAAAIVSAWVMKHIIHAKSKGFLVMELPRYRWPRWRNVGLTVIEKSKTFVWEAGKIILAVSVVLWVLASYGPADVASSNSDDATSENPYIPVATTRLENSYAGILGQWIEPAIHPLGYDWKIGIALITSFAAREVFVGTMATLYSVGNDVDEGTIKSRMKEEINPNTGQPQFTLAVAFSLLVFYAFAMQCMSTVAIVYRETKGWKWPLIQTAYMTVLAYFSALLVYQILS